MTARRPVPDALCSLATFNGAEGTGMAHLEAKVSAVLSAGRDLHREVSACPAHKVVQVRYTDLVHDLPGTLRRMADALSGVDEGRLSDAVLANVERLVLNPQPHTLNP